MRILLSVILGFLCLAGYAQQANPYGLKLINSRAAYQESIRTDSANRIVEIRDYIPNIVLDIRYATSNNFTGVPVYPEARAFARLPVVNALARVQEELKAMGLGLKIYDGYRPYTITVKFWDLVQKEGFVAHPRSGSRHNRGGAIDLTIVKLRNGKEIKMPTPYDDFTPQAASDYTDLSKKVKENRDLLKNLMVKHGFTINKKEWWHFDFADWPKYELMDIAFSDL